MPGEKILIVDDEKEINELIRSYLLKEGFCPLSAYCGREAMDVLSENNVDLIILDVMLPDIEGIELCLKIRSASNAPVLFLSCKSEEIDKIIALSVGGDDYMTKPFLPGELIARIKAHLRRSRISEENDLSRCIYEMPGLTVNLANREILADGRSVTLTAKEFDILQILIKSPKRIYSMDQLFELAWKTNALEGDSKTVMVYISNLRKKIESNPDNPKYILSIRGVGYKFNHKLLEG